MVGEKAPDEHRHGTNGSAGQRPRRGWERVTVTRPDDAAARATFRIDAPSPSEEVLAKHDADLSEPPELEEQSTGITCF